MTNPKMPTTKIDAATGAWHVGGADYEADTAPLRVYGGSQTMEAGPDVQRAWQVLLGAKT